MTALTIVGPAPAFSAPRTALTTHEHVGFELGWDYAHYRSSPPVPYGLDPSPLRTGLLAGQAAFGGRTLTANRYVAKWLQLRLHAWLRGRSVELVQVTPNYLQQIDVSHCPITRAELSSKEPSATGSSIDRVRNDGGYAAGNLVMMTTKANHAKAAHGFREALGFAQPAEGNSAGTEGDPQDSRAENLEGLSRAEWSRVAVLCSFVEPLPHEQACALPLLVLPPNRLRLFNPVQALQAFIGTQFLKPGWSHRLRRFEDLLPGKALQRDFRGFFMALLPRVIEAGRCAQAHTMRWALEDAWRAPLVQARWTLFARQLDAPTCEALLARAAACRLATATISPLSEANATDGWNLATRGYVPHGEGPPERVTAAKAQRQLAF